MDKLIESLLSGNYIGIILIGIVFLLFMSGIMAIIFIKYVARLLKDLDNVREIKPLVEKVEALVKEIHKLITSTEVAREVTNVEIDNIKKQIEDIYHRLNDLEKRVP